MYLWPSDRFYARKGDHPLSLSIKAKILVESDRFAWTKQELSPTCIANFLLRREEFRLHYNQRNENRIRDRGIRLAI
jgi:hypothetical protein